MKSVLFLLSHTEKGGGEVLAFNMIRRLDRARFTPFLGHVDFRKGSYIDEFRGLGVEPVDFKAGHLRNIFHTLRTVGRIVKYQRENKISAVVTTGAHSLIYAALARFWSGVPVLTHSGDYYEKDFFRNRPIIQAALFLKADSYLAASHSCLKSFSHLIPAELPREVAYPCVDPDFYQNPVSGESVRAEMGLKKDQKLISVIGRLQHWKGQDTFIKAAAKVLRQHPEARFAIVGGTLFGLEPEYRQELEKLTQELGIKDKVFFAGHRKDTAEWIAASDILVHASRTPEPGGTVISEVMSLGKPLVATSCGAPPEMIREGENGFLTAPEDEDAMAEKVSALLENGELCAKVSENAVRTVREKLNTVRMMENVHKALENLCVREKK